MENLDKIVGLNQDSKKPKALASYSTNCRTEVFASLYLETPVMNVEDRQYGFSVTACTWKGVPTIDDW